MRRRSKAASRKAVRDALNRVCDQVADGYLARAPNANRVRSLLDDTFFELLEECCAIGFCAEARAMITAHVMIYSDGAAGGGENLRLVTLPGGSVVSIPKRGAKKRIQDQCLISMLADIYEKAGGRPALSWSNPEKTRVDGPFARFLMKIYEVLPAETRAKTPQAFARLVKTMGSERLRDSTATRSMT